MSLLDTGRDLIVLIPEIDGQDDQGNPKRVPSPNVNDRVNLYGRLQESSSVESEQTGQQVRTTASFICRRFPAGAWARIIGNGREWDVDGEVIRSNGSEFTRHDTVTLRARQPRKVGA